MTLRNMFNSSNQPQGSLTFSTNGSPCCAGAAIFSDVNFIAEYFVECIRNYPWFFSCSNNCAFIWRQLVLVETRPANVIPATVNEEEAVTLAF